MGVGVGMFSEECIVINFSYIFKADIYYDYIVNHYIYSIFSYNYI